MLVLHITNNNDVFRMKAALLRYRWVFIVIFLLGIVYSIAHTVVFHRWARLTSSDPFGNHACTIASLMPHTACVGAYYGRFGETPHYERICFKYFNLACLCGLAVYLLWHLSKPSYSWTAPERLKTTPLVPGSSGSPGGRSSSLSEACPSTRSTPGSNPASSDPGSDLDQDSGMRSGLTALPFSGLFFGEQRDDKPPFGLTFDDGNSHDDPVFSSSPGTPTSCKQGAKAVAKSKQLSAAQQNDFSTCSLLGLPTSQHQAGTAKGKKPAAAKQSKTAFYSPDANFSNSPGQYNWAAGAGNDLANVNAMRKVLLVEQAGAAKAHARCLEKLEKGQKKLAEEMEKNRAETKKGQEEVIQFLKASSGIGNNQALQKYIELLERDLGFAKSANESLKEENFELFQKTQRTQPPEGMSKYAVLSLIHEEANRRSALVQPKPPTNAAPATQSTSSSYTPADRSERHLSPSPIASTPMVPFETAFAKPSSSNITETSPAPSIATPSPSDPVNDSMQTVPPKIAPTKSSSRAITVPSPVPSPEIPSFSTPATDSSKQTVPFKLSLTKSASSTSAVPSPVPSDETPASSDPIPSLPKQQTPPKASSSGTSLTCSSSASPPALGNSRRKSPPQPITVSPAIGSIVPLAVVIPTAHPLHISSGKAEDSEVNGERQVPTEKTAPLVTEYRSLNEPAIPDDMFGGRIENQEIITHASTAREKRVPSVAENKPSQQAVVLVDIFTVQTKISRDDPDKTSMLEETVPCTTPIATSLTKPKSFRISPRTPGTTEPVSSHGLLLTPTKRARRSKKRLSRLTRSHSLGARQSVNFGTCPIYDATDSRAPSEQSSSHVAAGTSANNSHIHSNDDDLEVAVVDNLAKTEQNEDEMNIDDGPGSGNVLDLEDQEMSDDLELFNSILPPSSQIPSEEPRSFSNDMEVDSISAPATVFSSPAIFDMPTSPQFSPKPSPELDELSSKLEYINLGSPELANATSVPNVPMPHVQISSALVHAWEPAAPAPVQTPQVQIPSAPTRNEEPETSTQTPQHPPASDPTLATMLASEPRLSEDDLALDLNNSDNLLTALDGLARCNPGLLADLKKLEAVHAQHSKGERRIARSVAKQAPVQVPEARSTPPRSDESANGSSHMTYIAQKGKSTPPAVKTPAAAAPGSSASHQVTGLATNDGSFDHDMADAQRKMLCPKESSHKPELICPKRPLPAVPPTTAKAADFPSASGPASIPVANGGSGTDIQPRESPSQIELFPDSVLGPLSGVSNLLEYFKILNDWITNVKRFKTSPFDETSALESTLQHMLRKLQSDKVTENGDTPFFQRLLAAEADQFLNNDYKPVLEILEDMRDNFEGAKKEPMTVNVLNQILEISSEFTDICGPVIKYDICLPENCDAIDEALNNLDENGRFVPSPLVIARLELVLSIALRKDGEGGLEWAHWVLSKDPIAIKIYTTMKNLKRVANAVRKDTFGAMTKQNARLLKIVKKFFQIIEEYQAVRGYESGGDDDGIDNDNDNDNIDDDQHQDRDGHSGGSGEKSRQSEPNFSCPKDNKERSVNGPDDTSRSEPSPGPVENMRMNVDWGLEKTASIHHKITSSFPQQTNFPSIMTIPSVGIPLPKPLWKPRSLPKHIGAPVAILLRKNLNTRSLIDEKLKDVEKLKNEWKARDDWTDIGNGLSKVVDESRAALAAAAIQKILSLWELRKLDVKALLRMKSEYFEVVVELGSIVEVSAADSNELHLLKEECDKVTAMANKVRSQIRDQKASESDFRQTEPMEIATPEAQVAFVNSCDYSGPRAQQSQPVNATLTAPLTGSAFAPPNYFWKDKFAPLRERAESLEKLPFAQVT